MKQRSTGSIKNYKAIRVRLMGSVSDTCMGNRGKGARSHLVYGVSRIEAAPGSARVHLLMKQTPCWGDLRFPQQCAVRRGDRLRRRPTRGASYTELCNSGRCTPGSVTDEDIML